MHCAFGSCQGALDALAFWHWHWWGGWWAGFCGFCRGFNPIQSSFSLHALFRAVLLLSSSSSSIHQQQQQHTCIHHHPRIDFVAIICFTLIKCEKCYFTHSAAHSVTSSGSGGERGSQSVCRHVIYDPFSSQQAALLLASPAACPVIPRQLSPAQARSWTALPR